MDLQIKFWQYISKPSINISILIASYNTKIEFINDCLKSIGEQVGNFGIELVWVNDGSSKHYSFLLENSLQCFKVGKKNLQVKYYKTRENKGLSYCLRYGVKVCSNDLIFRMDSDDIMINNRIIKQLAFMLSDPNCMMCGTDIIIPKFKNGKTTNN
jgi:glycosyltransferase involved in cell wall biosynthesis